MPEQIEALTAEVKKLKTELDRLRNGAADELAKKRTKTKSTAEDVLREARKKLRRVSRRLQLAKKRAEKAAAKAKKGES